MKKILVAMSGGVDSSVAAALLQENGYECIGGTMHLFDLDPSEGAGKICRQLGIQHRVFDMEEEFTDTVIKYFVHSYEKALTPNPCVVCNKKLKFGSLLNKGRELGCDAIATGHYARIEERQGRFLLKKARYTDKDQSYFLYTLSQEQLSRVLFPLGDLDKSRTREIAGDLGLISAEKKDSQDVCFIPDGNYAEVIRDITGKKYPEGDMVDLQGEILGKHKGIIDYTIGQRKGLGDYLPGKMYVVDKDAEENLVILGQNQDLFSRELTAEGVNWISYEEPPEKFRAFARTRSAQKEQPAWVYVEEASDRPGKNYNIKVVFDEPQRAISPGQSVVLYDGEYVIGGGVITA